ncbi:MAG: geranylgeranylglycerol-phosphate geranylgeranyltransferase, partial [Thermonemataceae bacterium]|nr:geranylgeranylglycerol-phosphate geranylgeranyltransferase [Thermonemataceae bacterium]
MRFLHKNKFAFLRAMFRLLRFGNLLMIGFTQYLVKIFFIDTHTNHFWEHFADQKFLAISSSTILVAAAGYIVNDYYDIKIDLINKPNEVVVGKLIRRRIALAANFTLNFLAITLAWYVSWQITIFVFFCIFLLWLYSNRLKRMPLVGNLAIAFLSAATIWIVALYYDQHWEEIYVYTFFAFFISLIREIIKDIEDMKGDAMFNCRTIPIIWGVPRTKKL